MSHTASIRVHRRYLHVCSQRHSSSTCAQSRPLKKNQVASEREKMCEMTWLLYLLVHQQREAHDVIAFYDPSTPPPAYAPISLRAPACPSFRITKLNLHANFPFQRDDDIDELFIFLQYTAKLWKAMSKETRPVTSRDYLCRWSKPTETKTRASIMHRPSLMLRLSMKLVRIFA